MLQALKLENAPTHTKMRTGSGSAADSADALFAGVMAQTALASAPISKTAPTSTPSVHRGEWAKTKDSSPVRPQPLEAQASPELRATFPTASTAIKEATKASDPAKAAVQTSPPVTSSETVATVANSSSSDGVPVAQQVQAGVGATVVQNPPPDPNNQALPAEVLQPALPQQPAFIEASLAAFAPQGLKQTSLGPGAIPAAGIPANDPFSPGLRQVVEAPSTTPAITAKPALTDLSPAGIVPQGLKQTSVLDPGSNPPNGKLPKDSALLALPKTIDTTAATPANSAKPALTDPSQTTVSPQVLNPTGVLGRGTNPAEGSPPKDSALLEFPKITDSTGAPPTSAAKPALTDPSHATVIRQGLNPTSVLVSGSIPAEGILLNDSAHLERPKTLEPTGAALLNSVKPTLTDPSQATIFPPGLKQTNVLGSGTNPAEGSPPKDSALLELPKISDSTGAPPASAAKPALTEPSQAMADPQEFKATTLGPQGSLGKGTPTLDPTLSGLPQAQATASASPSSSSNYPLVDGLSLAKAEIQILKPNPEMAKPSQAESPKPAAVRPQGAPAEPNPAGGQGQVGDKDPQRPSMKLREEVAQTGLLRLEDSTQTQRAHTSPAEVLALPIGEGIKTAPGATRAETPAVRPHPVFTQVEGSIRWLLQNKSQGAELQLHPESLGRMIIQLRVEGQEVHARLWASEASSLPILREHKAFLEASLKEQGLSLGSFDLYSGARHEQAQTASQERAMGNPSGSLLLAELKQEMPNKDLHRELLDSLDPHQIEVYA